MRLAEAAKGVTFPLYLSVGLFMISSQSPIPILALYALSMGAGVALGAAVGGAYNGVATLTQIPFGVMGDRVGRHRFFYAGSIVSIVAPILSYFATDVNLLIATRLVGGLASGMFVPLAYAYAMEMAPSGGFGRAMGNFGAVTQTGVFFGLLIGGFVAQSFGYRAVFLVSSLIAVPTLPLIRSALARTSIAGKSSPAGHASGMEGTKFMKRNFFAALASAFGLGIVTSVVAVLVPIYLVAILHETDARGAGIILATAAIGQIVIRIFMGSISDRLGRKVVIVAGLLIVLVGFSILTVRADFWTAMGAVLLYGLGFALALPATGALVADSTPRAMRGLGMGSFQALANGGSAVGAVTLGFLAEALGFPQTFEIMAISTGFLAASLTLLVRGPMTRKRPP